MQSPSSPANRLRSGSEFEDGESIVVNIEVGQHDHVVARMSIEEVERRQDLILQLAEIDDRIEQRRKLIYEFRHFLTFDYFIPGSVKVPYRKFSVLMDFFGGIAVFVQNFELNTMVNSVFRKFWENFFDH